MSFETWIDTLVDEKEYDLEHRFEVPGPSGPNLISLEHVIDGCKRTTVEEQAKIKTDLINLDFRGADLLEHFGRLASALAI